MVIFMIVDNEINILIQSTEIRINFVASGISIASFIYDGQTKKLRHLKKTIKYIKRKYNFCVAKIVADGESEEIYNIIKTIERYGIMQMGVL